MKKLSQLINELGIVEVAKKLDCDYHNIMNWNSGRNRPGRLMIRIAKQKGIDLTK